MREGEKNLHKFYEGEPIIKGAPVTVGQIFAEEEETGGVEYFPGPGEAPGSPFLRQFAKLQGIDISRVGKEALTRTGDYVYAGTERDEYGFERPVYIFFADAKASMARWGPDRIKGFQRQLGLPQTGMAEGDLKKLWDYAVEVAQEYAKAGMKVDVQFIFDTVFKQAVAQYQASLRGGGGGGGGAGTEPLSEIDYYFAMMPVLGDISGVEG
jgi:hypothetical protein